jgi:hypothetical protein
MHAPMQGLIKGGREARGSFSPPHLKLDRNTSNHCTAFSCYPHYSGGSTGVLRVRTSPPSELTILNQELGTCTQN